VTNTSYDGSNMRRKLSWIRRQHVVAVESGEFKYVPGR